MTANPSPPDQMASPASPAWSVASSGRMSSRSHGRSWSKPTPLAQHQPRANRFSVQFPIHPSGSTTPARTHSPAREPSVPIGHALEALTASGYPDGTAFLTLIAGQERRVLELKEELLRAEADLDKLKKHWARHEAHKKREDAKRMAKLQPLQTSLIPTGGEDDDGSGLWMQQEMQRRKALLTRSNTTGGRRVLPGQRHTRALSLLSPERDHMRDLAAPVSPRPPPPRKDSLKHSSRHNSTDVAVAEPQSARARWSAAEHLLNESNTPSDPNTDMTARASVDQEALLRTGKKIAADFKDGLWTFWEDLRQATVGDEQAAIQLARRKSSSHTLSTVRKQSSRSSLRPTSRESLALSKAPMEPKKALVVPNTPTSASALPDLADPSFWTEHGVLPPHQTVPTTTKKSVASKHTKSSSTKSLSLVSNDSWDAWDDSPEPSRSSSSVTSEANTNPSTVEVSPRTSTSTTWEPLTPVKRDPAPWPALKRSAGSLRKTASHLMQEWEKSLTPSPGEEFTGHDYIGAAP